jgi:hypothetical protein
VRLSTLPEPIRNGMRQVQAKIALQIASRPQVGPIVRARKPKPRYW